MGARLCQKGIGFAAYWDGRPAAESTVERLLDPASSTSCALVRSASGIAAGGFFAKSGRRRDSVDAFEASDLFAIIDGRLDDIDDLRQDLRLDLTAGAAEVLAAGYRRWQDDLLPKLRGEFAFVIWDDHLRRCLAARDPFGVRLLHFVERSGGLLLATDTDQFLRSGMVAAVPDDASVVEFLTRDFRSRDRSFIRGIGRLRGGNGLAGAPRGVRTFDYRRIPSLNHSFANRDECYEAFGETFTTAVRRRLVSSQAVIADLSGGYDSSSIVCIADRLLSSSLSWPTVIAASAVFPGLTCDETEYIDAVARHVRIPVVKWDGTLAGSEEFADVSLSSPGIRMCMSGGTEGYVAVARANRAEAVVSGLGGDHVGMPMGWALDWLAAGQWRAGLRDAFPRGISPARAVRNTFRVFDAFLPHWLPHLRPILREFGARSVPVWLTQEGTAAAKQINLVDALAKSPAGASPGQRARWEFLERPDLGAAIELRQRHADRGGLDLRLPFLDWDVVAFALGVPVDYWPRQGPTPRLHAEALRGLLPARVYDRRGKAEFSPAVVNAAVRQIPGFRDLLSSETWAIERYVTRRAAQHLLTTFRDQPSARNLSSAYTLRAIASVETWLRAISRYSASPGSLRRDENGNVDLRQGRNNRGFVRGTDDRTPRKSQ